MKTKIPSRARQRERKLQLRLLSRFEKSLTNKVSKIIAAQGVTLAAHYRATASVSAEALSIHKAQFLTVLRSHYNGVIKAFADRITGSLKSSLFADLVQQWITTQALSTVTDIDSTTLDNVKAIIANGIAEGLTTRDIASDIVNGTAVAVNTARATVIARTEMHNAANYAGLEAAKSTGLTLNKVWTAAQDGRTRPDHADADGQSVPINDPFTVGGESIDRPGDGSAGEAINCRCCLCYERVEEDQGQ